MQKLLDRIRNAKPDLQANYLEFALQMKEFYDRADSIGLLEFYDAYEAWEKQMDGPEEEAVALAKGNLDTFARLADLYTVMDDFGASLLYVRLLPKGFAGPVALFFRDVMAYEPFDPQVN